MALYHQVKYLNMISGYFDMFRQVRDGLWNCRCPYCGDSKKNKFLRRGFFKVEQGDIFYYCHNCHKSSSFPFVLKDYAPNLFDEYKLEVFNESRPSAKRKQETSYDFSNTRLDIMSANTIKKNYDFLGLLSVADMPDTHSLKQYIKGRQIPEKYYKKLFYTNNYSELAKTFGYENYERLPEDERLVIPFYDSDGEIEVIQGRDLSGTSHMRYITIKKYESSVKCYGLDEYDSSQQGYVFEGPIDSMFIDNAVASADADLTRVCEVVKNDPIFVYDAQPRNVNILNNIQKAIDMNLSVCLLPEIEGGKDINDMILEGRTPDEIKIMIHQHTYKGLKAKLAFGEWRKINNNKRSPYGKTKQYRKK